MKVLLDENLPKKLKSDFNQHYQTFTIIEMGWAGYTNGALMKLMLENGFTVLLTFDKNLQFQQNFEKYSIAVLVYTAKSNSYNTLTAYSTKVIALLKNNLPAGPTIID